MNMFLNTPTFAAIGVATIAVCLTAWVPFAQYWNERSIQQFCQKYGTTQNDNTNNQSKKDHDILLIVSPNSGTGTARKLFPSILQAIQATGRVFEIYVLTSAMDAQELYITKDLSVYQSIVLVAGDSTLYELIQGPLQQNKGHWPYQAPILLLPGGSSNVIYSENFGYETPVEVAIDQALNSNNNNTNSNNVQWGSVIQLSSPHASTPTRYAVHTCFDGIPRHMVSALDKYRNNLYAAFGFPALIVLMIYEILACDKSTMTPIQFHFILSDSEAKGMNLGYGLSRFGPEMVVTLVDEWPGYRAWFAKLADDASGKTGADLQAGKSPPSWVQVLRKTHQFSLSRPGHAFHLMCDGTTTLPFHALDQVHVQVLLRAVPYYAATPSS